LCGPMGYKQGHAERAPVGATKRYLVFNLQWETRLRKTNSRLNIEISFQNGTRNCVSAGSICMFKHYLLICSTVSTYTYTHMDTQTHTHMYIHFHRNTFTHCPVHLFRHMMPHQTLKCHTNAHIQIQTEFT
jgi:hypothetical protein